MARCTGRRWKPSATWCSPLRDRWQPSRATLELLSTLMPLRAADVTCECKQVMQFRGEKLLQISVKGTLEGDEAGLGKATDTLDGGLYIRPADGTMHSLNLRAERRIVDDKGNRVANWSIDFRLSLRPPEVAPPELADDAVAKLPAAPNMATLALIAPYPQCAVDVLHPRSWRPETADGTRFVLRNALRNEELALNFETPESMPSIKSYADRVRSDLAKSKNATLVKFLEEPTELDTSKEHAKGTEGYQYVGRFALLAKFGDVQRVQMYHSWQRGPRGVTSMASCHPKDIDACRAEAQFVLQGLKFTAPALPGGK
jgi:hypothetical protein